MARIWTENQGNNFELLTLQVDDFSRDVNLDIVLLIFSGDYTVIVDEGFTITDSPHL